MDPETKLTRIHVNGVKGNLKILVDPAIQEQVVVHGNKILMTMRENPQFTFTREELNYPFKKDGNEKLTIITIKANPLRKRAHIERESTHIVYQRPGYRPDIRAGAATKRLDIDSGQLADITTYDQYLKQAEKLDVRTGKFMEQYDELLNKINSGYFNR